MGSFNAVCAVSGAVIRPSDKVRLVFLVSNPSHTHDTGERHHSANHEHLFQGYMCYAYDNFEILGVPLEATYEDYNNWGYDEESAAWQYTLKRIKEVYTPNVIPESGRYNSCHDYVNISKEALDASTIQDMIHSGSLNGKVYGQKVFIKHMAIHESIYQLMLRGDIETYDRELEEFVSQPIFESHEKHYMKSHMGSRERGEKVAKIAKEMAEKKGETFSEEDYEDIVGMFSELGIEPCRGFCYIPSDLVKVRTPELDKAFISGMIILTWFDMNHKCLQPTPSGSQDYDLRPHIQLLRDMADALEETRKVRDDERWEDDEDYE